MAVVWIITTGNSDFKLEKEDGFSHLRTEKNQQLKPCQKGFPRLIKGDDKLFFLPARVMGILYGDTWDTHKAYFKFPLLDEFLKFIKNPQNKDKYPDRIIVLLTNQENIFLENSDDPRYDRSEDSPYWRDTFCLEELFKHYFDQEFGKDKVKFVYLKPKTKDKGLDNWDSALELVQDEIKGIKITEEDRIIVSHQAGTPAISSAVQFASLAKFGEKVTFLIGNERDADLTRFLEGSEYLKGIRKREATTLLSRHDYSGVEALIKDYLKDDDTKNLLKAATQWNFAKFDDFADEFEKLSDPKFQNLVLEVNNRRQHWWWIGYEAAYLAFIRLDQKNAVEAFFHSFRAVEGLISRWTEVTYPEHVDSNNDSPQVPDYLSNKKQERLLSELKEQQKLGLHSFQLYDLLRKGKPDWRLKCEDLPVFTDQIAPKRNKLFHRLKGLEVSDVFQEWKVNDLEELEVRIRRYLNFITDQSFNSLTKASLMSKVHQELERAIAHL